MFIHALFYFIGKCFVLPYKIKPSAILHTNLLRKFGALRTKTETFDRNLGYLVFYNVSFCPTNNIQYCQHNFYTKKKQKCNRNVKND